MVRVAVFSCCKGQQRGQSQDRNWPLTCVDLVQAYSKRRDLADTLVSAVQQLRKAQAQTEGLVQSVRSAPLSTRQWRIGDRLSQDDREQLLAAFTAGTSKRKLAERYGISESSVKRLIRQQGASKGSKGLPRPSTHEDHIASSQLPVPPLR
jgi:uncharacterized alpha-E superfamily protein